MYNKYQETIQKCIENKDLFNNFKNIHDYVEILEHVSFQLGIQYLVNIWNDFHLDTPTVKEFCDKNDKIGNPVVFEYGPELTCSPTSLRYIYHALLILNHIKSLNLENVNLVEVGCGYGGLCLAIDHFSKSMGVRIKSYSLIDLEEASALQKKYLSHHTLDFECFYYKSNNYGEEVSNENTFLISNYCFSEIDLSHQKKYLDVLFPKCSHGFITWNLIDYYDIGKKVTIEDERPQTDMSKKANKFVKF